MTVRTRLTLWYAAIMFVSLIVMGGLTWHAFAPEPPAVIAASPEHSGETDDGDLLEVLRILLWCGVPSGLLAIAGGWWLMRRAFSPIAALTRAAERIHEGNLENHLPRSGNGDELDRLTEVFNAMTARLHGSFQRIREFTLHASHELKTPLTVLHGEYETELNQEHLPPAQREKLLNQMDEIRRLTRIVDGLTLLTKADAGQIELKFEQLPWDEITGDAYEDAQILAKPAGLSVHFAPVEKMFILGDRHRLRQLLLNLTDNAVKYNQPGGRIDFALRRDGGMAELTIVNTGKTLRPEVLPRVFDPFYRGDPAHSAEVEGCGLGLSICRWIVRAHRGEIRMTSAAGHTAVIVRLPLAGEGLLPPGGSHSASS